MDQMWNQLVLGEGDCTVNAVWRVMTLEGAIDILDGNWRAFATHLGLPLAEVGPLVRRMNTQTATTKDAIHEILTLFRAHNASAARMSLIIEALQSIGAATAIEHLRAEFLPNREEERQNNRQEPQEAEAYNLR